MTFEEKRQAAEADLMEFYRALPWPVRAAYRVVLEVERARYNSREFWAILDEITGGPIELRDVYGEPIMRSELCGFQHEDGNLRRCHWVYNWLCEHWMCTCCGAVSGAGPW